MNFVDILESSKKNAALLLWCLLDRIPLIISNVRTNEEDRMRDESMLENLAECFYFRHCFKYNFKDESSINNYQDYLYALEKEKLDDNVQRLFVLSLIENTEAFFDRFLNHLSSLNGWIMSCIETDLSKLLNKISEQKVPYVCLNISKKFETNVYGISLKKLDLSFEKYILEQIDNAVKGLHATRSVIKGESQKILPLNINGIVTEKITDNTNLVKYIKILTLQSETSKFLSNARRVLAALNIVNLLVTNYGIEIFDKKVSGDRLNRFMTYESASIERILSFIDANYHKNITQYVIESK